MKLIPLTRGMVALVDDCDYEELMKYKWNAQKGGNSYYAGRRAGKRTSNKSNLMHRYIMGDVKGTLCDHIDGNGLNNQKSNLRIANKQENGWNRKKAKNCISKFKGVTWHRKIHKWVASIILWENGIRKRKHIGCYEAEIDAALAYDAKARECFKEFAHPNIMEGN